ncbi:vacuolar proton ATPase 100-kDa subunit [Heterostelium album PN500]|uniref:V-type proton ATPase subunit a n=1 Tax=Heterostelium pallidum (strain ATCC 26659 / Pp 5 / PN500) TaxID=670386 RepID=D3BUD3_HETP5|nr:vacuolar proton ATPase 100-kDa subunit [Heterostelium album PN500]EFA74721.1 vacuolar proton ATPase 100-kDa subunit [Heterostelium album PN500]|eukprot:XP_020426855.1 vacuolar proton ATPase 100-kDa subunit [Heterostelium album PN500]
MDFIRTPLWRSAPMQMVQLFVQIEAAHDTVDELGKLGLIQFKDHNEHVNIFQRYFVNEVKRCDEMDRKLKYFEEQINKDTKLARILDNSVTDSVTEDQLQMDELESRFDELEAELRQVNTNQETLQRNYNELIELRHVLTKDAVFFQENPNLSEGMNDSTARSPLLSDDAVADVGKQGVKLGFITGVMNTDKMPQFQRSLWRTTRGNNFVRDARIEEEIIDPQTGEDTSKTVFIVFFQGDRLQQKIKKICESFGANVYDCPDTSFERANLLQKVSIRISDLQDVLNRSKEHKKQVLLNIVSKLVTWRTKVLKEKAIYHTMNLFDYDVGRKCLIAKGWCPKTAIEEIQTALRTATTRSGALVPSVLSIIKPEDEPPTYFETNKYTNSFQQIVNAYGVAKYREVNPAVLTIITFPFLFGVMFGDVGHGVMMLAASGALIALEKKLGAKKLNEIIQMPFDGRYVLFLMSLFSIYIGFIYNECFSIPMDLFGSAWRQPVGNETEMVFLNRTYPFGVDPVWKGSPNELDYYNSFKMKLSVLLGVVQMTVGIIFSLLNYLNMKGPMKWVNIFTQFIPQVIFLWSIFGYMCFLILLKWAYPYRAHFVDPPFILPTIIAMFLTPTAAIPADQLYFEGQTTCQIVLVLAALISVPVMLIPKPFIMKKMYQNEQALKAHGHHHEHEFDDEALDAGGHHGEEFEFGEVFIHQVIHTIEFVLGAISNTASYLRLWALSLAHSELSTVFWERILIGQIEGGNPFLAFIGFGAWLGGTVAVLLMMESLSAFLHALRLSRLLIVFNRYTSLHWVEFQNKFYAGSGVLFKPFSYNNVMTGEDEE